MSDRFDLKGKTALVTGASSGLGRHFAETLAAAGATVAVAARRADKLAETVAGIEAAGGKALAVAMDVTDRASIAAAFDAVEAEAGTVTVVVNNAGIVDREPAMEVSEEHWDSIIGTNLSGVWAVAQEAARRMRAADTGGSIVNIASLLAKRVSPGIMPYAVSKAGVAHMTRSLAVEWAEHGIRVNAIAPGYFETDLNRDFLRSERAQGMIGRIPFRRVGEIKELDGPLLLLCSEAGSYMSGTVISVDGGHAVNAF